MQIFPVVHCSSIIKLNIKIPIIKHLSTSKIDDK
ncbi:unnamed protein product [Brugia timori]|uniref:Uncharacterized protein n=1 Tax=Brugia timori TaxID=42155 RepID=A0A0R3RDK3_9BILA|nr:unnamed protein product [Brugia timori]